MSGPNTTSHRPDRTAGHPVGTPSTGLLLLGAGLMMIALNLRIGVAEVGPVLPSLATRLGLSATLAGVLTAIPVFAFGAFAFLTPGLTRRFGMHRLLALTMLLLAIGLLIRWQASLVALFTGTVVVGAAIAMANVLMPAAIKRDFSHRTGLMMGLYSTMLFVGASLASGLTTPLAAALGGPLPALAVWAVPAVVALLLFLPQVRRSSTVPTVGTAAPDAPVDHGEPAFAAILRDPVAFAVTGFMGLQSVGYYAAVSWVPTILTDHGMSEGTAGWMMSFSALPAILTCLAAPVMARRIRPLWLPVLLGAACLAGGYAGLIAAPTHGTYLWMTLLGLGQGASISLALTYIVWRSPDAHHTGHVSTMAQGFGYLIAGLGPFGLGALHSATGEWTTPLLVLLAILVLQAATGILASLDRHVGGFRRRPASVRTARSGSPSVPARTGPGRSRS